MNTHEKNQRFEKYVQENRHQGYQKPTPSPLKTCAIDRSRGVDAVLKKSEYIKQKNVKVRANLQFWPENEHFCLILPPLKKNTAIC